MNKKIIFAAITLWSFVAAMIAGMFFYGINWGFGNTTGANLPIKEESVLLDSTQNIVVVGSHQRIEIRKTNHDSIKVTQYSRAKAKEQNLFLISKNEDSIRIYFDTAQYFSLFNFNMDEKLVIEIPQEFAGNLDVKTSSGGIRTEDEFALKDIELESSSGGIYINEKLIAESLDAVTSSGGVHADGEIIVNENVVVKSSSGGVNLKRIEAKELRAESNSGGIRLGIINVERYYLHCSSGRINSDGISGAGEARTSSGGIQLSLINPKGDIKLITSSGGIKIELEPSLEFTLDAKTSSGGINTNFMTEKNEKGNKATAKIGSNPVVNITAQASSGGIRVEN